MNKKFVAVFVLLVLVLAGGYWFLAQKGAQAPAGQNTYGGAPPPAPTQTKSGTGTQAQTKGTMYFSVTDAAANMGAVSAVNMTVDRVEAHSETQGWVTVSNTPETFSLLELKAKHESELLAKADVAADTYNQVRFHISHIVVTEAGKIKEAKLPSNEFRMSGVVKVEGGAESSANFDVLVSQSFHETGKGEIIFAPVIKLESRSNATVQVSSTGIVTISGGNTDSNASAGMDLDGSVKANFHLDLNTNLELDGGVIKVMGSGSGQSEGGIKVGL